MLKKRGTEHGYFTDDSTKRGSRRGYSTTAAIPRVQASYHRHCNDPATLG
jgi:hypothetical protein